MKEIYSKIQTRLETVSALKWIDSDEGQLDYFEIRPAVTFPCCLFDIELVECADQSATQQMVRARVTFRLAFEPLGAGNSAAPVSARTKALEKYDTVDAVFNTFQGWYDTEVAEFSRASQTTEKRDDNIRVIRQVWDTNFIEEVTPS